MAAIKRFSPLDPSARATRLKPKLLQGPIVSPAKPKDSNHQLRQYQRSCPYPFSTSVIHMRERKMKRVAGADPGFWVNRVVSVSLPALPKRTMWQPGPTCGAYQPTHSPSSMWATSRQYQRSCPYSIRTSVAHMREDKSITLTTAPAGLVYSPRTLLTRTGACVKVFDGRA